MTQPMIKEHNIKTGEVIEREMNAAELAAHLANQAEHEAAIAAVETKATMRQAVLTKLGLTAEEAAALLS